MTAVTSELINQSVTILSPGNLPNHILMYMYQGYIWALRMLQPSTLTQIVKIVIYLLNNLLIFSHHDS